jgi:hypothetical protein
MSVPRTFDPVARSSPVTHWGHVLRGVSLHRRSSPPLGLVLFMVVGALVLLASCRSNNEAEGGPAQATGVDLSGVEVEMHHAVG